MVQNTYIKCWEPPCLVSEAVTPMAKAESETLGPKTPKETKLISLAGALPLPTLLYPA